jgi:hypothetical protein
MKAEERSRLESQASGVKDLYFGFKEYYWENIQHHIRG